MHFVWEFLIARRSLFSFGLLKKTDSIMSPSGGPFNGVLMDPGSGPWTADTESSPITRRGQVVPEIRVVAAKNETIAFAGSISEVSLAAQDPTFAAEADRANSAASNGAKRITGRGYEVPERGTMVRGWIPLMNFGGRLKDFVAGKVRTA